MRPIRTNTTPNTYSGGTMADVADLPCRIEPDATVAIFDLSNEERKRVLDGGMIELIVTGHPLPPVSLNVTTGDVVEEWEEEDLRCVACLAVWRKTRGFQTCNHCGGRLSPATPGADPQD